ncbi:hypothetical protein ACW7BJ_33235 [Azospirillum argentinense]
MEANTTVIPSIGLTFSAAAQRIATILEEDRQDPSGDRYDDFAPLDSAMMAATPRTPADVLAVLDRMLCPQIGLIGEGHRYAQPLQKVRDALAALFGAGPAPSTSTIVPMLGLTFRDAVDRCLGLIAQQNAMPTETAEDEERADAIATQWLGLADKLLVASPITPADGVAITDLLLDDAAGLPINNVRDEKLSALANLRDLLARQATPPADDAALLDAFRRWAANEGAIDDLSEEDRNEGAAVDELCEESDELIRAVAALPARTSAGLCVKVYLLAHWENGCPPGKPATAINFPPSRESDITNALHHSMVKDALVFLPELNALMGGAE